MIITIVYDNNFYDSRLTVAWGFSCVVNLSQRVILFDTGGDGLFLLDNMVKLGIDPKEIDVLMLSHIHGDHTGGLAEFLKWNSQVTVYLPASFPRQIKEDIELCGANVEEVCRPLEIFEDVFSTGELNGGLKEQSLAMRAPGGTVVITGCAHPGVVNIVKRAEEITGDKVYLAMGGFHIGGTSQRQVEHIADKLIESGVKKVSPCHCSGEGSRRLFGERFGENYIESGAGKQIIIQ